MVGAQPPTSAQLTTDGQLLRTGGSLEHIFDLREEFLPEGIFSDIFKDIVPIASLNPLIEKTAIPLIVLTNGISLEKLCK